MWKSRKKWLMLFYPQKQEIKRVIAVGTTSVRSIESAALFAKKIIALIYLNPIFPTLPFLFIRAKNFVLLTV